MTLDTVLLTLTELSCPPTLSKVTRHSLLKEPSLTSDGGQRTMIRVDTWTRKPKSPFNTYLLAKLGLTLLPLKFNRKRAWGPWLNQVSEK